MVRIGVEKRRAIGVATRNASERLIWFVLLKPGFNKDNEAKKIATTKLRGTRMNAPGQPAIKKASVMIAVSPF